MRACTSMRKNAVEEPIEIARKETIEKEVRNDHVVAAAGCPFKSIRVMQANVPARHFWVEAISKFAGQAAHPVPFEKAGVCWTLFSFDSKGSGIA